MNDRAHTGPDPLIIERYTTPSGGTIIKLCGEIDTANVRKVDAALREACQTDGDTITVDMGEIDYCDSACLHALIVAWTACEQSGRKLSIVNESQIMRRVLEVTGLQHLLEQKM